MGKAQYSSTTAREEQADQPRQVKEWAFSPSSSEEIMYCEGNGKNEEQAGREEGPEL